MKGNKLAKEKAKMNKSKLGMMFLVALVFLAGLVGHAQSDKGVQPRKAKQKVVSVQLKNQVEPEQIKPQPTPPVFEIEVKPANIPHRSPFAGPGQGYQMVIDVLDGFGGESESDNYRLPVNSGGDPSAIGLSASNNYGVEAGYVYATFVRRGDANADGVADIGDAVVLINYLFRAGPQPCPMEAGDFNCDGEVELGDIVVLINYLFRYGPSPSC